MDGDASQPGQVTAQGTLLRENAVGRGLVPLYEPLKPMLTEAFEGNAAFQDRLVAETADPC